MNVQPRADNVVTPMDLLTARWRTLAVACGLLVAGTFASVNASADEAESVRLNYIAPSVCPSRSAFIAAVDARTDKARFEQHGRTVTVQMTKADEGYTGELLSEVGERRFKGASCAEVSDALALALALSIDPEASEPLAKSAPAPVAGLAGTPAPAPIPAAPAPLTESIRFGLSIGPRLALMSGTAPVTTLPLGGVARLSVAGPFAGAVRLGAEYSRTGWIGPNSRSAEFSLFAGDISPCIVLSVATQIAVDACAQLQVGSVRAEGLDVPVPAVKRRFSARLGSLLAVRIAVVERLDLELGWRFAFQLVRDEFIFEQPERSVFATPTFSGGGMAALTVRLF